MHERNDFTSPENFVPLERHLFSASTKKKKERREKENRRKREESQERKKKRARKVVESGVTYVGGEESLKRENTHYHIYTCTSSFCEDEDTSRLLPDTSVRIQHLLPSPSSKRLHGVCSDWAGDFSLCDERRGMSLRFEVISLFLKWSCLSASWIYYRNCFALVTVSNGVEYRVLLLDEVI